MLITARHYRTDQPVQLELNGGIIEKIHPVSTAADASCPCIGPGLMDLQVNGYKGVDFNDPPVGEGNIQELVHSLWEQGVTSFFPTVITNSGPQIIHALKDIVLACEKDPEAGQSVCGIHLEGPFISPQDGPRGAHDKAYVQPPDWDLFSAWQEAAEGKIRLITLSPEWPGSNAFIEKCVQSGVKVSIGHTAADATQIQEAVAAGATLSTHLGNATHLLLPRHPNYIWEQLASETLWASIIADGFHLPDAVLKVFLKVKQGKSFLVSDTTRFAGLSPGIYTTHIGGKVKLDPEGRLSVYETPQALAGSAKSLLWCVEHLVKKEICTLAAAWDLASVQPAAFLGDLQPDALAPGMPADLVLFGKTEQGIRVLQTIKSGKIVFNQ